jgi:regulator of RNase E activity RraA
MSDIIETVKKLSTSTVSDAMDRLGIAGQCLGVKPLAPSMRLCGRAFTMRTIPVEKPSKSVGDYIDDVPEGHIVVIDNGGRQDATVWGDILTWVSSERGVGGTVIDGVCRDIHQCLEINYPVYTKGWSMRTGKDRVQLDAKGGTVSIGDARVSQGDLMFGDADGVVCLPAEHEEEIVKLALEIEDAEEKIRAAFKSGKRLDEARKEFRYFQLQSREDK